MVDILFPSRMLLIASSTPVVSPIVITEMSALPLPLNKVFDYFLTTFLWLPFTARRPKV